MEVSWRKSERWNQGLDREAGGASWKQPPNWIVVTGYMDVMGLVYDPVYPTPWERIDRLEYTSLPIAASR
jgi:hypothetical protein